MVNGRIWYSEWTESPADVRAILDDADINYTHTKCTFRDLQPFHNILGIASVINTPAYVISNSQKRHDELFIWI